MPSEDLHLLFSYMDLDGRNINRLRVKNVPHVFSLTQFDDNLYWSDWNLKSIYTANKFSSADEKLVVKLIQLPNDIAVVHPLKQIQSKLFPMSSLSQMFLRLTL